MRNRHQTNTNIFVSGAIVNLSHNEDKTVN